MSMWRRLCYWLYDNQDFAWLIPMVFSLLAIILSIFALLEK